MERSRSAASARENGKLLSIFPGTASIWAESNANVFYIYAGAHRAADGRNRPELGHINATGNDDAPNAADRECDIRIAMVADARSEGTSAYRV